MLAVAAAGGDGCAFTVTAVADEIQVGSVVLLTNIICDPAACAVKVVETW